MKLPIFGYRNGINVRPTKVEDLALLVEWMNDPQIQETLVCKKRIFSVKGQEWQLAKMSEEQPKLITYSIFLVDKLIGRLKLSRINWQEKSAHVSIMIMPDENFRGKGYGTKALELLVKLAKEIGLKKLISKIQKENITSKKIHEKVGFQNEKEGGKQVVMQLQVQAY